MAKKWKGTDQEKAIQSLNRAVDNKHDPAYLDKIARTAKLEKIRDLAAQYRDEMTGYVERAEKNDPKCPQCGAPMVKTPYYTAVKGAVSVSNVKSQWTLNGTKTSYIRSTPYSDLQYHTAPFCPRCASRKTKRMFIPAMVLLFGGLAAALVFGIILIVMLIAKSGSDQLFTVTLIGLAAGILLFVIGYKLLNSSKGVISWAGKKRAPITTEEFEARERGIAFYGPKANKGWDYNSGYDLSMQYITSTTLDKILHEKKANVALSTGFVRQMQEKNGS